MKSRVDLYNENKIIIKKIDQLERENRRYKKMIDFCLFCETKSGGSHVKKGK